MNLLMPSWRNKYHAGEAYKVVHKADVNLREQLGDDIA